MQSYRLDPGPYSRKKQSRLVMLNRLLMPGVLLSFCVVVHAVVMTTLIRRLSRYERPPILRFWRATWRLIQVALWMVSAHLFEIGIWASFFTWHHVFSDFRTSFYFSAVTYTTVGYGDLVLPETWRLVAAAEALTGILMCGWSTGVFFAVVSGMYSALSAGDKGAEKTETR